MTHQEKIELLKKKACEAGLKTSVVVPPLYKLLWKFFPNLKPPVFRSYWHNFLLTGLSFGLLWGGIMSLSAWREQADPFFALFVGCSIAGTVFGLVSATYLERNKQKLGVSNWEDFGVPSEASV